MAGHYRVMSQGNVILLHYTFYDSLVAMQGIIITSIIIIIIIYNGKLIA
jgi:hypothetical protein